MSNDNCVWDGSSSSNSNNNSGTTAANIISSSSSNSSPRLLHNITDNIDPFCNSPATCSSYNQFLPSDDDYFTTFNHCINDFLVSTDNNSLLNSPSSDDLSFDHFSNAISAQNCLNQASFILENNHLHDYSYTFYLSTLQKSIKQLNALHQENENLRLANADLVSRINLLSQASCLVPSSRSYLNNNHRLTSVGDSRVTSKSSVSPTSVIQQNNHDKRNHHKISAVHPKSISVRSSNHEKTNERRSNITGNMNRANRSCNSYQPEFTNAPSLNQQNGAKREVEGVEMDNEVYNQGMQKTELCNKWEEGGECPYGNNCRFAHGIAELRPVIRHPRYKTEICRMFISGNMCPYGHRCHFRHSSPTHQHILQSHASLN
ncbi:Butyrate response factor 1 [Heracleum sosnowskyi]|uniref:Butyrate response factor 1 n=1 Tax=Heracleum sosnowskyi TaxID=360622 RepID=A0AAD8GZD4_9APIA|nr:Butyrate response factor 1 [Heracleum sosnowskyi]